MNIISRIVCTPGNTKNVAYVKKRGWEEAVARCGFALRGERTVRAKKAAPKDGLKKEYVSSEKARGYR